MDHQTFAQLLGNYGEFLGAIAVVVTLGYLAVQVRHSKDAMNANTNTIRADAARDVYRAWSDWNLEVSRHPDRVLIDKIFKPDTEYGQLDHEEQVITGFFFRAVVQRFASEYALYEAGILTPEVWQQHCSYCASFVSAPALADLWKLEQQEPIYTPQFVDSIRKASQEFAVMGATPHQR